VNPQAVNEAKFDVLTRNKRSVLLVEHEFSKKPIAIVAVGALMVGGIIWTSTVCEDPRSYWDIFNFTLQKQVRRGDELGYFAYGGSTAVAVFPPGVIRFDDDLVQNSMGVGPAGVDGSIETLMKVGHSLGVVPDERQSFHFIPQSWLQQCRALLGRRRG